MNINRSLRGLAGLVVLVSLALTLTVDPRFVWLTAFVGANLLQSAFTNWCPAMALMRKAGMKD